MINEVSLSKEEIKRQFDYMSDISKIIGHGKKIFVQTFGCQQNEADSEKLLGMAEKMGYEKTNDPNEASLILINTCAVREHAELKALSIAGGYKHCKEKNPGLIIGICGCMVSQEHRKSDIKNKYPYIDFLIGTTLIHRFPEILYKTITEKKRNFVIDNSAAIIAEGLPVSRDLSSGSAYVSIMYGCNNFCTYCIVPYVRGRERSRDPEAVLGEIKELLNSGVKEITLLGQNVNSYRPLSKAQYGFKDLLTDICKLPGEAIIHFMTSHPKDASKELIDVMAKNPPEKGKIGISSRFHLPLQSGSDRVLKAMNRHYDTAHYKELIYYMRERIPDITITTDIIVGFPGESEKDFNETLDMLKEIRYDNIYSFIYSKRSGTPAAVMENQIPDEIKGARFQKMVALQTEISKEKNFEFVGKTVRALVEGISKTDDKKLTARTASNRVIHFEGDRSLIGEYVNILIENAEPHVMYGRQVYGKYI